MNQFLFLTLCCVILSKTDGDRYLYPYAVIHSSSLSLLVNDRRRTKTNNNSNSNSNGNSNSNRYNKKTILCNKHNLHCVQVPLLFVNNNKWRKQIITRSQEKSYYTSQYQQQHHRIQQYHDIAHSKLPPAGRLQWMMMGGVESVQTKKMMLSSSRVPIDSVLHNDNSSNNNNKNDNNIIIIIKSFIDEIITSINERTFVTITINGVSNNKKKKKKNGPINDDNSNDDDDLRGRIRLVTGRLIALKSSSSSSSSKKLLDDATQKIYLQVTFKYHLATDIVKNWDIIGLSSSSKSDTSSTRQSITTSINNEVQLGLQTLFGIIINNNNDDDNNNTINRSKSNRKNNLIPASEWDESDTNQKQRRTTNYYGIKSATLELKDGRILELNIEKATLRWKKGSTDNSNKQIQSSSNEMIATHDRTKKVPLAMTESFWQALGITIDTNGTPVGGMSSKVRQCQKFVEIMDKLIEQQIEIVTQENHRNNNTTKNDDVDHHKPSISVVDMGCGRGYLTFGLHSFLNNKYTGMVQSRGIDVRPKLVKEINTIAQNLGDQYKSLRFETGTITSFLSEQQNEKLKQQQQQQQSEQTSRIINVIIALHACDTATDDAIWSGISSQADIIVVAPCCHKEIRPQLNKYAKTSGRNHPLYDILRHNIYRERISETVTDSIRALLLELAGYSVQVFEFIGGEHTSKNVMITAIRQQQQQPRTDDEKKKDNIRHRIRSLGALHGIQQQTLAQQMNEYLFDIDSDSARERNGKLQSVRTKKASNGLMDTLLRSTNYQSMPPLPTDEAP